MAFSSFNVVINPLHDAKIKAGKFSFDASKAILPTLSISVGCSIFGQMLFKHHQLRFYI